MLCYDVVGDERLETNMTKLEQVHNVARAALCTTGHAYEERSLGMNQMAQGSVAGSAA